MITVYTTETCSFCAMVKKYLTLKEVQFETVDVTNDATKRKELFDKTNLTTVPIIMRDDGAFTAGWNPAQLKALVGA